MCSFSRKDILDSEISDLEQTCEISENPEMGGDSMGYHAVPYEKRIKENIRNYSFSALYDMESIRSYLKNLAKMLEVSILLTDRHGEKQIVIGDELADVQPDVAAEPGLKIRVQNRTVAHLYYLAQTHGRDENLCEEMLRETVSLLERLGEESYLHKEGSIYMEELEKQLADGRSRKIYGEREDALTGVCHKLYFESRMKIIDRSEVIPVAVLELNINDWKYANDHFGDEESDRLIRVVADILKEEAESYFVIGRMDGDVFGILIPMAEEHEAEKYIARVKDRCLAFQDEKLSPSVAAGVVYKTNIEQSLEELLSDAEYIMLEDKIQIKNSPGYRERLEKI